MNKKDFPIFTQQVHGKPLTYLDSAASAQKPMSVLKAMQDFAFGDYANVHRGNYLFSELSTEKFEEARIKVAEFIHAKSPSEIVFTRNATESLNLIANTFGRSLSKGDEVIVSVAEHHSNLVPWQILSAERGIKLKFLELNDELIVDLDALANMLSSKTKLVSLTQASNVLGCYTDVKKAGQMAHAVGAKMLVDGCQAVVHQKQDMQDLDCDFYAFSGHKIYGPTGIGVLYGKYEELQQLPVWQAGGDMVRSVSLEKTYFADPPAKFEAGTPAIIESVGLAAALDYVTSVGTDKIEQHERALLKVLEDEMREMKGIRIYGNSSEKAAIVSFTMDGIHPQDAGMVLDREGVCVRVGTHCAEPLHKILGTSVTIRASLGLYNDEEDITRFLAALRKTQKFFA